MPRSGETLVVVPAFNEQHSIARVVQSVTEAGWDCLVVDDGSRDRTRDIALHAGATTVSHATNLGVGAALRTGYRFAVENGYARVVQCDADGQHRASLIQTLVDAAVSQSADLVIGSRFLADQHDTMDIPTYRRFIMRWLSWTIRRRTGVRISDTTSGFKCTSEPLLTEFARSFPANFLGDTFEACLVAAASGYRVIEIATPMDERSHGSSSASPMKSIQYIARSFAAATLGLTFTIAHRSESKQ